MPKKNASLPGKAPGRPPEIGIGKLLRCGHMGFSRQFRQRLQSHGVTFGEFIHLEKLWQEDGLNQTEISRRAGVETASSTAVLDRLEKRGYVSRERNGSDRRNINVFLRPAGIALKAPLLACARSTNLAARKAMTEQEVVTFFALMQKILGNLDVDDVSLTSGIAIDDRPPRRKAPAKSGAPSPRQTRPGRGTAGPEANGRARP